MHKMRLIPPRFPNLLAAAGLALTLAACGGGGKAPAPATPGTVAPTVSVSAGGVQAMAGGRPVALTATTSDSAAGVSWRLDPGSPGSLSATSGATVGYLPPAAGTLASATEVGITASAGGASKTFRLVLHPHAGPAGLYHVAGDTGGPGHVDGVGTQARFADIGDGAADDQGNLYVLQLNDTVRKVTPAGVVSTTYRRSGAADSGAIDWITRIAADGAGNVYLYDRRGIHKLAPDGSVGTVTLQFNHATNLIYSDDRLNVYGDDTRIVAGAAGMLYVMETDRISMVAPDGTATVLAGMRGERASADGQGSAAHFARLKDIALAPDGNLFVLDACQVRKLTPSGVVTTLAGSACSDADPFDGSGTAARFSEPLAIALNAADEVLVLDVHRSLPARLRKVRQDGAVSTVLTGVWSSGLRAMPDGRVFMLRAEQINEFKPDGSVVPFAGNEHLFMSHIDGPSSMATFDSPTAVAGDASGNLYVLQQPFGQIGMSLRKIAPDGTVSTPRLRNTMAATDGTAGLFSAGGGIAVDRAGNLYIGDATGTDSRLHSHYGGAIYKVTPQGDVSLFAGIHDEARPQDRRDGSAGTARFSSPTVVGFDADGNLYVRDWKAGSEALRRITPAGVVSTISTLPPGWNTDPDGTRYVANDAEHTVSRIAPDGSSTVIAGMPGRRGTLTGALGGGLDFPKGLVRIAPTTFLLVSGNSILKLVLP